MRREPLRLGALAMFAAVILTARVEPLIVFNASPSVPTGFYLRIQRSPAPGDFVTVRAAAVAPDYARVRGFSDDSDRFIKRVAAGAGTGICADGDTITVGAQLSLTRSAHDHEGRALPRWVGCRALAADELFLIGDTPDSFDSRYWGPVSLSAVDGVWKPIGIGLPETRAALKTSPIARKG